MELDPSMLTSLMQSVEEGDRWAVFSGRGNINFDVPENATLVKIPCISKLLCFSYSISTHSSTHGLLDVPFIFQQTLCWNSWGGACFLVFHELQVSCRSRRECKCRAVLLWTMWSRTFTRNWRGRLPLSRLGHIDVQEMCWEVTSVSTARCNVFKSK